MAETNLEKWERKTRSRPGAAARIDAETEAIRTVLRLQDLRKEMETTQVRLAEMMQTSQENISRIERSTNPYVSTLADYIGALGGRLEIQAVFDDEVIPLAIVDDKEKVLA